MKARNLIDFIVRTYSLDDYVACMVWDVSDIIDRSVERDLVISEEEAREILDTTNRNADCDMGISWSTIDVYTDAVIEGRETASGRSVVK